MHGVLQKISPSPSVLDGRSISLTWPGLNDYRHLKQVAKSLTAHSA